MSQFFVFIRVNIRFTYAAAPLDSNLSDVYLLGSLSRIVEPKNHCSLYFLQLTVLSDFQVMTFGQHFVCKALGGSAGTIVHCDAAHQACKR